MTPIQFSTSVLRPDRAVVACVVVTVFDGEELSRSADIVDRASNGRIRGVIRGGDMSGKNGKSIILHRVSGIRAQRVLLVRIDSLKSVVSATAWSEAITNATKALAETGARDACYFVTEITIENRSFDWKVRQFCSLTSSALYRFNSLKSTKTSTPRLGKLMLGVASNKNPPAKRCIAQGRAIAAGTALARDLGNLPGNVCTPTYLARKALQLGKEWRLRVRVFGRKEMQRLAMGALLSVAKGSRQPPKFIVIHYDGAPRKEKPTVLVGKGITFDSGGISLKPGAAMDEMKFDMCGAAAVLGTIRAVAELQLKINVVGLIPATENMPDGAANKPGDVIRSMSGKTIEVLNTDAEGRLVLCDALNYAERLKPKVVVDIATLTGACIIALGHVCSGLFANKQQLANELINAGNESSDRAWQLPLFEEYMEELKSNFADMANVGGRAAGSITAAAFLSRFASKYDWAHLDIAGTAWISGSAKGATGRPVPLLLQYLMTQAPNSKED